MCPALLRALLVRHSYMCARAWRTRADLNPGAARVVSREFSDERRSTVPTLRGGPGGAQHVDILGNHALLADLLVLAATGGASLEDRIVSDIERIADAVDARLKSRGRAAGAPETRQ